ncbi:ERBB receptor feedback inhibitor 1a [Clupea harengus]|uniref:ERBB receptor feedback inhibitor 1a n=1 Tax=Clupea harengus TaxID=7950 RepID=A0A6P3WB62_CLUHA|nr:ERBB receptor feedback inhibitor 1a [Clupea harengus]
MRPDCSWSMSTAGLTAQEVCLPSQALFLRGSHCHSMAGTKPSWNHPHDFDNHYFSFDGDYKLQSQQQVPSSSVDKSRSLLLSRNSPAVQRLHPKKSRPSQLTLSSSSEPLTPSPVEDDQVVPSFQRLSVCDRVSPPHTPSRVAKPLPPLPGSVDLSSSDQAMDSEVGFFVDDSCSLVPEPYAKPSAFRYGTPSRRSFRGRGMINYAYHEGPSVQQRQPQPQSQSQHQHQHQHQQRRQDKDVPEQQHQTQHQHPHHHHQQPQDQHPHHHHQQPQDQHQHHHQQPQDRTRKLRRSHSGPAGSFNKPTSLRVSCHHRNTNNGQDMDKPEIPPRAPIPPRPAKTADYRRWSAEVSSGVYSDEDRPPKVPPREPLSSTSTGARTPSPKSLPTYLHGIMPPTQSFAPDPKYVSRGLQRQNSEGSPCILPVMENGHKASNTHYFLLPQRPAYLDKLKKFLTDSPAGRDEEEEEEVSRPDGEGQSKRRAPIDFV